MLRIKIVILLLLIGPSGFSKTVIFGTAQISSSDWVYLYEIDDFITRSETLIQKFKTNKEGRFYFEIDNNCTKRYVIRRNNTFTELYLQPNSTYKIILPTESIEVILISPARK